MVPLWLCNEAPKLSFVFLKNWRLEWGIVLLEKTWADFPQTCQASRRKFEDTFMLYYLFSVILIYRSCLDWGWHIDFFLSKVMFFNRYVVPAEDYCF